MKDTEAVVHADFSENFACKFNQEIQSFHFGGSRNQVTLHTGILYVPGKNPLPFSSVSPYKDHGPPAIWAHLKPILDYVRTNHPQISTVHFFLTAHQANTSRRITPTYSQHLLLIWGSNAVVGHFLNPLMEREPLMV